MCTYFLYVGRDIYEYMMFISLFIKAGDDHPVVIYVLKQNIFLMTVYPFS